MISESGLRALKLSEGLRLVAYDDGGGVWTIGYGSTRGVSPGMRITSEEADARLAEDVKAAERAVREMVRVGLEQNERDALINLVFNIGSGNFAKSTLLQKLNAGSKVGAAGEFMRWHRQGNRALEGLVLRRWREAGMFLGTWSPD